MNKYLNEIHDNEIRIISADEPKPGNEKRRSLRFYLLIIIGVLVIIGLVIVFIKGKAEEEKELFVEPTETATEPAIEAPNQTVKAEKLSEIKGYVAALDTSVNNKGLLILSPENARPRLVVGSESLNHSNIILAMQAADVRRDNGKIVGAFVLNGELISKGEAKAGFCSIINGELSLGIADATPMLEQALTDGGYFFRQYPLVVGGQIVENRPKGKAIRKALAEIGGKIYVVIGKERLTFHDFSQLLIDIGARNAIYLVGSASYGFYVTEDGDKILTGKAPQNDWENISYIIWEKE